MSETTPCAGIKEGDTVTSEHWPEGVTRTVVALYTQDGRDGAEKVVAQLNQHVTLPVGRCSRIIWRLKELQRITLKEEPIPKASYTFTDTSVTVQISQGVYIAATLCIMIQSNQIRLNMDYRFKGTKCACRYLNKPVDELGWDEAFKLLEKGFNEKHGKILTNAGIHGDHYIPEGSLWANLPDRAKFLERFIDGR